MRKVLFRIVLVAVLAGLVWGGFVIYRSMPQRQQAIATAKVRRGDVVVRSHARGELRAVRSTTLIAPNLFGTVQVTKLAPLGAFAREKDLIVEFDDSEVITRLEEKQLEIDQIDEQIKKAEADLAIRNNQDQVELLRARYSVRRAELEVKRNELLPDIDAKKNVLNLEEARRRLKQLESDVKSRQEQAKAEIAVLHEKKNKANLELGRERERLSQVRLLSPMSGLVAIRQNRPNFMFPGMQIPDIREGDQVQPGVPVADILDLSELELVAKVGEIDRAGLKDGQEVNIRLDALGEKSFRGHIKSMSGTASANVFSSDPAKKFDVIFSIDMKQLLTALNAKPEQIARVLATAEQNRRKPAAPGGGMPPAGMMMAGGAPPSGMPGPRPGMAFAAPAPSAGGPPSPADQQKIRAAMEKALKGRKMQDLSPEERGKVMAEVAKAVPGAGRPAGGPPPGMGFGSRSQFSEKELAAAKLPPAPEDDSELDVLIRPGLLADVEIILEKIPNAINVPAQAVTEKDGKPIVWVKTGSRFEERQVKPLKRTESTMIIASGLQPGETVALSDPNAKPGDKKKDAPPQAGPMGGMPAGGGGR